MSAGRESKASVFIATLHCSHNHLLSISRGIRVIGVQTLLGTEHVRDLSCVLLMRNECMMIWGGAKVVMLALESGCKFRLSLAEKFDCTGTIINQLLADSFQNPISGGK